jgi:hypothetical protein
MVRTIATAMVTGKMMATVTATTMVKTTVTAGNTLEVGYGSNF